MRTQQEILSIVNGGLVNQFQTYSWLNMIDDLDLTKQEKEWAKEHIDYKAYTLYL